MSFNIIPGLPTIIESQIEPRWQQTAYLSHEFNAKFPINFAVTKRAEHPMSTMNISAIVPELTVTKGLKTARLDESDQNVILCLV